MTELGVELLRSAVESGLTLLSVTPRTLRFGSRQPVPHDHIRSLEFSSGREVVIEFEDRKLDVPVEPRDVARGRTGNAPSKVRADRCSGSAARAADELIEAAVDSRASDIHIEPDARGVRVRYRIDGELIETVRLPESLRDALVSRLKIMATLDIAEKRRPQDGRIRHCAYKRPIDLRVSTMPGVFGEKVVVRVLDRESIKPNLRSLGMTGIQEKLFESELQRKSGLILVTGPTGSGKTTTLYAALQTLDTDRRNVITIEDPIEYELPGVSQSHVRPEIGYTFPVALRSFLRQDPDVIMVGEIRDEETAAIAVRAALTGHLVLSTLHTNDSIATISRLLDMGIKPYLLASALRLVIAQRLVRQLCNACSPTKKQADGPMVCIHCQGTGIRGRNAVFETLPLSAALSELIEKRAPSSAIRQVAESEGFIPLDSGRTGH